MIDTSTKFIIFIILQLVFLTIWFLKLTKNLDSKSKIFWTVDLLVFFGIADLLGSTSGGMGGLGLVVLLGIPFSISFFLLIFGLVFAISKKLSSFFEQNKIKTVKLPGSNWVWFLLIFVGFVLLFMYLPSIFLFFRRR